MKNKKKQRPVFSLINGIHPKFPETKGSGSTTTPETMGPVQVSRGQRASGSALPPSPPPHPARPLKLTERQLRKEPVKPGRDDQAPTTVAAKRAQEVAVVVPGRVEALPDRQPVRETTVWTEKPGPEVLEPVASITATPVSPLVEELQAEISSPVQVMPEVEAEEPSGPQPVQETSPQGEAPKPEALDSTSPQIFSVLSQRVEELEPETGSMVEEPALPTLRFAAVNHNFGQLLVGQSENWELSVYNDGDEDLLISGLEGLPTGAFKLISPPQLPFTIRPRNKMNLIIQFAPELDGVQQAGLRLHSEAVGSPFPEITLSGTAIRVITSDTGLIYSPIFHPLGMAFVYIEAGTFVMGSPETEPGRGRDELEHEVIITKPYYLQSTPVTQKQWQAIMGDTPAKFSENGDDRPVEGITWSNCQEFIKRLNSQGEGLYRLPTEAEWEYACRAQSITAIPNGDIFNLFCDGDPNLDALGWYCYNADNQTHPVGLKDSNPWGLYDMHGNISEWCQDWYGEYAPGQAVDPQGPQSGREKVVRGGSWLASAKNCRSASRFKWPPNSRNNLHVIGFRLVREV